MKIVNGIVDTAIQKIIPIANNKARPRYPMTAEFITIHNTANAGVTAKQNADYVVSQNEYKSWHFTVGNNEVYQHLPINESGWHCGDGENGAGNRKSIGIEIAEVYGADRTAVKFIAELVKQTGIPVKNIVPHKAWSGKNCPRLILPHWDSLIGDIKAELGGEAIKVEYSVTTNKTYQLCGDVNDFGVKIVNQKNQTIEEPYCVNGTFFWWEDTARTKTYPTSILYANGKLYQAAANHLPYPQSVFIVYKDNTVEMKRIKNITELDMDKVRIAIGGVGIRNILDSNFKYDPAAEGFKDVFEDVLRKSNKTVIGYNAKENKICLMVRPNIYHKHSFLYDLQKLVRDCEYDIALSVDGGGSTFMNNSDEMVVFGDNRRINNIIGFNL